MSDKEKNFPKYVSAIVIRSLCQDFSRKLEEDIGYMVQKETFSWGERPIGCNLEGEGYHRSGGGPNPEISFYAKNGFYSDYKASLKDTIEVEGRNAYFNKAKGKKISGTGVEKQKQVLDEVLKYVANVKSPEDFVLHWYEKDHKIELPEKQDTEFNYNITPDMLFPVIGHR